MPSSIASTSIVALSVSISARTSPGFTGSPSFLSHFASLPCSIVGERAGIRMSVAMDALLSRRRAAEDGGQRRGSRRRLGGMAWRRGLQECRSTARTGSGSGSWVANSAASLTTSRTLPSISLSSSSVDLPPARRCAPDRSIGSCSSRMPVTSSLVRYFAGSDMEWPR